MVYLLWKLIHVLSVVIFLGNIITGLFWAARAHKTKNFNQIASTFKSIIQADRFFTIPGVIGITAAGMFATVEASIPMLSTGWVFWSIVLFIISGILFSVYVAPLQKKIVSLAESNDMSEENWSAYEKLYDKWEFWGFIALLTPVCGCGHHGIKTGTSRFIIFSNSLTQKIDSIRNEIKKLSIWKRAF